MKTVVDLSPLRVPPGVANLSSVASNGEPIVAWVDPRLARRVRAFRLIGAALQRCTFRREDYRNWFHDLKADARPAAGESREFLFGTRSWQ